MSYPLCVRSTNMSLITFNYLLIILHIYNKSCVRLKTYTNVIKSIRNYHYSLNNNREERSSHLLRGGSLKSRRVSEHDPLTY